jgi:hypothetical protein
VCLCVQVFEEDPSNEHEEVVLTLQHSLRQLSSLLASPRRSAACEAAALSCLSRLVGPAASACTTMATDAAAACWIGGAAFQNAVFAGLVALWGSVSTLMTIAAADAALRSSASLDDAAVEAVRLASAALLARIASHCSDTEARTVTLHASLHTALEQLQAAATAWLRV